MSQLHLLSSLATPGQLRMSWRRQGADPLAYLDIDHFVRLAQVADRAGIDAVFLGDGPALRGEIATAPGTGIDPLILLGHVAALTERLGVIGTSSTTYNSPYNLARRFQSLDVVTHGRAGVNIVTTHSPEAAANFGLAEHPDKDRRYRRAQEFLEVVTGLWDGWAPDAIIADKQSGRYADPAKIRALDHHGEFFDVAGPLSLPAGPQGRPLVVQAGGSEGGLRLAGTFADAVFTVAQTRAKAIAFREEIRGRAQALGRDPDKVKISLGVTVIVAATEAEANRRRDELFSMMPVESLAAKLATQLGLDPARFGADDVVSIDDLHEIPGVELRSDGFQASNRAMVAERPLTLREMVLRTTGGSGHRLVVGSAEQVADDLESWWRDGTCDGFTVMAADASADFESFARLVVPILIERGLFVPSEAGSTLRERLGA